MKDNHPNISLRWLTLLAILLNIAFNWLYPKLFPGLTIEDVSRSFKDLFTPAGYVFAIWGLIYLSFIVYGIVQLLPSNREALIYDRLSQPLLISNVLSSLWIIAFIKGYIMVSLIIIVITLILSIVMFVRVSNYIATTPSALRLSIPFSIFCGWLSVATIACAAVTLKSIGWDGGDAGPQIWTIAMLIVAGILAIVVDSRFNNYIYGIVIVWASIGIWDQRQVDHPTIALIALISSMMILVFIMGHALIRYISTDGSKSNADLKPIK